jgi:hypothetical protein
MRSAAVRLLAGLIPAVCRAQSPSVTGISGTWKVVAVEVVPNRVQALSEDDPAYVGGAILDISAQRVALRATDRGPRATLSDLCTAPRLLPDGTIHCAAGSFFGPPGAKLAIADGRLRLDWYDGGRLILQRQG